MNVQYHFGILKNQCKHESDSWRLHIFPGLKKTRDCFRDRDTGLLTGNHSAGQEARQGNKWKFKALGLKWRKNQSRALIIYNIFSILYIDIHS